MLHVVKGPKRRRIAVTSGRQGYIGRLLMTAKMRGDDSLNRMQEGLITEIVEADWLAGLCSF